MRIAIVAALPEELAPLARLVAGRRPPRPGAAWSCRFGGRDLTLMTTGDGAPAASRAIETLLGAIEPGLLIGVGCAGGATSDLAAGALVVADRVVDAATGESETVPDTRWLRAAQGLPEVVRGTVVTTPAIARGPERKGSAARSLEGPVVVDLESWSWARAAAARAVPFVVLRGVTDALEERLPLDFEALRSPEGGVDRRRALAAACWRPGTWLGLARLRRRLRAVARDLATGALEVMAA